MHKLSFYPRMALRNLRQNRLFYGPFALTAAVCTGMCYIMRYLSYNDLLQTMRGASYIVMMLGLGSFIMIFLAVWIMAYANGFVIRRRKRELALYNILGMEKRHIARVLGIETLFLYLGCTLTGILGGALFSKLVLLGLLKLIKYDITMGFNFCWQGAAETAVGFAVLFFALYLYNLRQVQKASPIELLHGGEVGEKEPKSRFLLALFGLLTLGGGYALSLFTENALLAILLFFVAVALVIIGTHCLFGAGSVVALKALRKNKKYYYQPRHFTAVSGLIYRMNQNARGLANICILATTVLVSVATTVCLYTGIDGAVKKNFPNEIELRTLYEEGRYMDADPAALDNAVQAVADRYGCPAGSLDAYDMLTLATRYDSAQGLYQVIDNGGVPATDIFVIYTLAEYNAFSGQSATLAPGEVLFYGKGELADDGTLTIGNRHFTVKQRLDRFAKEQSDYEQGGVPMRYLVVADRETLYQFYQQWQTQSAGNWPTAINRMIDLNPGTLDETAIQNLAAEIGGNALTVVNENGNFVDKNAYVFCQAGMFAEYYNMYGGYVFLGLFLATMFMIATVLIIYYKQLTEGYDDRERFVILQKVGMSAEEVRGTISAQVRLVFFLPLGVAGLHVAAAYPMLMRLVSAFGITDSGLFIACILGTLAVFTVCYVAVYAATAKKYYRIVRM